MYGSSEVVVNPDGIDWRLEVTTYADSTAEAKALNDQSLLKVKELLKKSDKVEKVDITGSRLDRTYNAEEKKQKPFNANTFVTFQSFAVSKQPDLATGISQIPSVSILSCRWITTNRVQVVKEARTLALQAAREKAKEMAVALDMLVGSPVVIEERSSRSEPTELNSWTEQEGITQSDAGGKVHVGANVRVVFELLEKPD